MNDKEFARGPSMTYVGAEVGGLSLYFNPVPLLVILDNRDESNKFSLSYMDSKGFLLAPPEFKDCLTLDVLEADRELCCFSIDGAGLAALAARHENAGHVQRQFGCVIAKVYAYYLVNRDDEQRAGRPPQFVLRKPRRWM